MRTFKQHIAENSGLRFIYENLNIKSSIGRKYLLNSEFVNDKDELETILTCISKAIDYILKNKNTDLLKKLNHDLCEINDISTSIKSLKEGIILDDIALFEIKKFSIVSEKIKESFDKSCFKDIIIFDLTDVVNILDPESSRIPSFYIYSAYNDELTQLRKEKETEQDETKAEKIRERCNEIEDEIRQNISKKLTKFANRISHNLEQFAYIDIIFAKAEIAINQNFARPEISNKTEYTAVFNPQISKNLIEQGKSFQPIDISINNEPILITGANMSGKSVLLKTIALCQYLFQFGFFIPAKSAKVKIVDEIIMSFGDNQNEMNGLSSFAVEMLNINTIIAEAKSGKNILALVDELARTTNPDEGKAFVSAFVQLMSKLKVSCLITTHYSGIKTNCSRLMVKGLSGIKKTDKITVKNINNFMDYSLLETNNDSVPNEAIRIAEILEIDSEFIQITKSKLE
ncbi:MAG TPA: DNA mismatch repair protein MutS [Bacteroidales bacterium]|nr:DNA mismatch repair protein MutS [Bacteroidales bacterium]